MEFLRNNTISKNGTYVSETVVADDECREFYVVVSLNPLLYATFEKSYLDFLNGLSKEPLRIEGNDYLWFDINEDRGETPFWQFYCECLNKAKEREKKDYLRRKYSHLKKPTGSINFEIVQTRCETGFSCGPMGNIYEIKFHILDNNSFLFVNADDWNHYSLTSCSIFDNNVDDIVCIESFEGFSKAKKSKYYDLYLAMEKFIDGVIK